MKTKEKLLTFFEQHRGFYFSGEELAGQLSVSRTAVWKAVNRLREEGYQIDAVQNRGYCLAPDTDILSVQGIRKYLDPSCFFPDLQILSLVDSTNSRLREAAAAGAPEGTAILAACQSAGRGRSGRHFYSPDHTGVYMSLLLRPEHASPGEAVRFTTMAAVAACEAIEEISGQTAGIKWVNDIYMDGRKVSGILTEASLEVESGLLDYAVLGIGFNLYPPENGFPEELSSVAGAILPASGSDGKNRLAAGFLNHFMARYHSRKSSDYAADYRRRSLVIGQDILVLTAEGSQKARALDVDEDCRLLVRFENGKTEYLASGEIRVRIPEKGVSH